MMYEVTVPKMNPSRVKSTGKKPAAENFGQREVDCCTNNESSSFSSWSLWEVGNDGISFIQKKQIFATFSDFEMAPAQP